MNHGLKSESSSPALVPPLGAAPGTRDQATFRVWAPGHASVRVEIGDTVWGLLEEGNGLHSAVIDAPLGSRYRYVLDGEGSFPDPCSRSQPDGVGGASELIDTGRFVHEITPWVPPSLEELVIYELHVGTFTGPGTFDAIHSRLAALRELGVRAIELMPIATFPGRRGWGYDGLYTWAPHPIYGGPDRFAALVDAAHRADLGVIVDVVYNHLGPGPEAITAFGPYRSGKQATLWGEALDYSRRPVREWAIQNAELWIRDYRVDGLRIDAAHAIFDDSDPHVLAELASRVRAFNPKALVISEIETGDLRPIEQWGHDAQWADELHHALHALLTGERDGYYQNFGTLEDLAWALKRPQGARLVVCAQNHDQVGNRAFGDRLHGKKLRLAAFCVLLAPGTPLLFMGEEYDERHPFQYFTDHIDPAIAEATRSGRRREFAGFASFAGKEVPDPQSESTFLASKLDPDHGEASTYEYYRYLLRLRTQLKGTSLETIIDETRRTIRVRRGQTELAMNFSDLEVDGIPPWSGVVAS